MPSEKKMDSVILGLLSHESLTGYEIKKRMDTTLKFFWSASFGSIYPTLNSLVQDGLVTRLELTDKGRDKIIYTITDKGRGYLKQWLVLPVTKDELRYETLLKLFFGSEIGPEVTIGHIVDFETKIEAELPYLEGAVRELKKLPKGEGAHSYYLLTAMFGVEVYKTYLEWCKEAKKVLEG